ncbi:MAG: hypothetical protein A2939_04375 [Parcubacteria group bacterium RIFCSPLOWO2_01_FULL_48_18]|nr:MAG: hypothetical protein A3J67_03745 [Parcubacteria group bacterium RIFCSPHIGHO2_02_FULL_48_10b]OHB22619.1 MAG: hypothetical protein A2939_04375 [Parcubacteria group bacterium RIFCSPLOWO2_01_FULL_48_18]
MNQLVYLGFVLFGLGFSYAIQFIMYEKGTTTLPFYQTMGILYGLAVVLGVLVAALSKQLSMTAKILLCIGVGVVAWVCAVSWNEFTRFGQVLFLAAYLLVGYSMVRFFPSGESNKIQEE